MSVTSVVWLLLFIAGTILAFYKNPIYGLYTYLLVFYTDPQSQWWAAGLPGLRWSLVSAGIMLAATMFRTSSSSSTAWHGNWAARCLILYVAWMWVQTIWAVDPNQHFEGCVLFTKYVVLFFAIYRLASSEEAFTQLSFGHVLGCAFLGWKAYNTNVTGRLETVILQNADESNMVAAHLVTGLVFGGCLWFWVKNSARWIPFLALPFILNTIVLTASRGAFIAMFFAGIAVWFWSPRKMRLKVGGMLVLGGVLLAILANDFFTERMSTLWSDDPNQESSGEGRILLMKYGLAMSDDYPLGAGHRGYTWLSSKYMPAAYLSKGRRAAHATWVAVLVDQGWPGMFLFVILLFWIGYRLVRLLALDRRGLPVSLAWKRAAVAGGLVACFAAGLSMNLMKAEVEIWLLAMLAVIDGLCRDAVRRIEEQGEDSSGLKELGAPTLARSISKFERFSP